MRCTACWGTGEVGDEGEWGRKVKTARLEFGMSQPELAAELGMHYSAISRIERGIYSLDSKHGAGTKRRISEHLGVSFDGEAPAPEGK